MRSEIKITDKSGGAVIDIEGVIGVPEKMQFDDPGERVATYAKFTESLKRIGDLDAEEVVVNIRSTGGDVNDALLIYDALAGLDARIVTRCWGYVASAATIIAQAASPGCREISANTLYLIHCSESAAEGNSRSLSRTKQMLEATDSRIAAIYAMRSGRPEEEFAALMNENGGNGRWMSAEEAVEAGLADKVIASAGSAERVVNFADLDATLDMLGLPAIPRSADEANVAKVRYGLLRRLVKALNVLGIRRSVKRVAAPKLNVANKAVNAVVPSAQDSARATSVMPVEDPSLTETVRTANDRAYENDALSIANQ